MKNTILKTFLLSIPDMAYICRMIHRLGNTMPPNRIQNSFWVLNMTCRWTWKFILPGNKQEKWHLSNQDKYTSRKIYCFLNLPCVVVWSFFKDILLSIVEIFSYHVSLSLLILCTGAENIDKNVDTRFYIIG